MKAFVLVLCCGVLCCTACNRSERVSADALATADTSRKGTPVLADISAEKLVVPGAGVGLLSIGGDMEEVLTRLGKPSGGDAAMGSAWLVWYHPDSTSKVNDDELDIFSAYADSNMVKREVRQIRVTSPEFKTDLGVGVGTTQAELSKSYPRLVQLQQLLNRKTGDTLTVFDDAAQGIAFDVCKNKVAGVIVHRKAMALRQGYLTLRPEWQPLR